MDIREGITVNSTRRTAFHSSLFLILLTCVSMQAAAQEAIRDRSSGSIPGLLRSFYNSLTFPEGKGPDWGQFRSLFGFATSPCVRVAGDSVMTMDREGFIAFFSGRIAKGTLKSFSEIEISRTGEYYGRIAQVFSTYEKRMNLSDGGAPVRGINSFSLYLEDGRWWIASVVWQDEAAELPIPGKYLNPRR
jgi:hypothetical protein